MKAAILSTPFVLISLSLIPTQVIAQSVIILGSQRDNTLYEDSLGSVSNGSGEYFFSGKNSQNLSRRAVLAFEIAGNVPNGSIVTQVSLTLYLSRTSSGDETISLYRVLSDWGEGASNAPGNEGSGTNAQPGDATWVHTFFDTSFWSTLGGDFLTSSSASTVVGDTAFYTWSSPQMANDVQSWLENPSSNFGWILLGNENVGSTAKRFNSRENSNSARRPFLTLNYMLSTGIRGESTGLPEEITLFQNYPNPFNPMTLISFSIPSVSFVKLSVYNLLGQLVAVLLEKEFSSGHYDIAFDASELGSGLYFCKLEAGDKIRVRKMLLHK
jgi:hypothetical protein